ncbi:hypothetical protein HanIR_Chr12g0602291 [Helianthus annuus]|nr:hypothetical protein HanIR_Chr12g0602291 [Helianthus annuus]
MTVFAGSGIQIAQLCKSKIADNLSRVVYKIVWRSSDFRISCVSILTCHPGFLLLLNDTHFSTKIPSLLPQHKLSNFNFQQQRYESNQGDGSRERDQGGEELEDGEGEHELKGVRFVGPPV